MDPSHEDNRGRGALQFARGSGGKNANLYEWLLANAKDSRGRKLRMTYGKGRDEKSKRSGRFGEMYRNMVRYEWKGKKKVAKGKGYEPTGSSSSRKRPEVEH